jgi:hypothetical protein
MARTKPIPRPQPESPQISPQQGEQLLRDQIAKADELLRAGSFSKDDHSSWELLTRNYLEKAFGRHSPKYFKRH